MLLLWRIASTNQPYGLRVPEFDEGATVGKSEGRCHIEP
jgi:hypothetical protein